MNSALLGKMGKHLTQHGSVSACSFLKFETKTLAIVCFAGMNAAVRAVVRMGLYVGAKVYFIHEVSQHD